MRFILTLESQNIIIHLKEFDTHMDNNLIKEAIRIWNKLIYFSDGELELSKCLKTIMQYTTNDNLSN